MRNIFDFYFLYLLIISIFLFTFPNGLFFAFDKDEPKYLEAAREMLIKKDYVTPYFNFEYRFDKPILIYLFVILGYLIFGISTFSGRLFPSLCGVLTVIITYLWVKKYKGKYTAFKSALVLMTTFEFAAFSSLAMPDILLTCFIAIGLFSFYIGIKEEKSIYFYLSAIFFAFATLSKGPVGIILPSIIIILFSLLKRKFIFFRIKTLFIFSFIFLLIALPWYAIVLYKHGIEFFKEFIIFHNIKRFLSKIPGHPTNPYYYLINSIWAFFPWTFAFFIGIFRILKKLKKEDFILFNFIYFLSVILFFQVAHTKLIHYLLPAFVPFAILISLSWKDKIEKSITFIFIFIVSFGFTFFVYKITHSYIPFLGFVSLIIFYILIKDFKDKLLVFSHTTLFLYFIIKYFYLPLLNPYRIKENIAFYLRYLPGSAAFYKVTSAEIIFYSQKAKFFDYEKDKNKNITYIVTNKNGMKNIKGKILLSAQDIFSNQKLYLLKINKPSKNIKKEKQSKIK